MHVYLSHPQVLIDPAVPVPEWGLSPVGQGRVAALAKASWLSRFRRIVSSTERKAIETAEPLAAALGLTLESLGDFHENDRSSTGFLPPEEFEQVADQFFASPRTSIRGWERACDAQSRIVRAMGAALAQQPDVPTLFVGHGGVGTLLKCHLKGIPITRTEDQTGGGGNHFGFAFAGGIVIYDWRPLETAPE